MHRLHGRNGLFERARIGKIVTIKPGQAAPLTLSWRVPAGGSEPVEVRFDGGSLTLDEARVAMGEVMDGEATPAQLAAMLMGLRMRGETIDELAGFATAGMAETTAVPDDALEPVP